MIHPRFLVEDAAQELALKRLRGRVGGGVRRAVIDLYRKEQQQRKHALRAGPMRGSITTDPVTMGMLHENHNAG